MSSGKKLLLCALLGLGGCGFTPLYGGPANDVSVAARLDTVTVQNIPERPGQMLRLALETELHGAGAPVAQDYTLAVSYTISTAAIGIQQDTASTRNRYVATASWALAPIGAPNAPLAQGMATSEDAENVVDQQYFALTLESGTVNQQLANEIAAQITQQVAAYFKTHAG